MTTNRAVSVVVPTYQRPAMLERCLDALLHLEHAASDFEIIVVDNAACPETRQQVAGWRQRGAEQGIAVRYLATTRRGPAAARNVGWRAGTGRIIAFTDDDCVPDHCWLYEGLASFVDTVEAVSGRIVVPLPEQPTDYEYSTAQLANSEFATANCFYLRSTLERVGGFDEHFTAAWREDSDLFFTLLEQGCLCAFASKAIVVHPVRPDRWGVSLSQQSKSIFNALLYKKHPDLYRQRIQAQPPWHYYRILGSYLLLLQGILKRSKIQTACGFGLWLALTAHFCLQRLRNTSHRPEHISEMIITSALIPPLSIFWRIRGALKYRVLFL